MKWNWQHKNWPNFSYDIKVLEKFEQRFLTQTALLLGTFKHLDGSNQVEMRVDLLTEEALNTSAIEGEYLNRDGLQSSIRRELGLSVKKQYITPAEEGITEMMLACYESYANALSHKMLYQWHKMLTKARHDLERQGAYRQHPEPMLIVSHGKRSPTIHFEAPPSHQIKQEMKQFIRWFNDSAPKKTSTLPPLLRAGISHLYFESIHPFEDGNGRIGRAIAIKALSQSIGQPLLLSLSQVIERHKKSYYKSLQATNCSLDITEWLTYFSKTILAAQEHTQQHVEFLISKTKFFDKFDAFINSRQHKVLLRMFRAGPDGFSGGLSAENFISITKASRATATRDLHALVALGALTKTGERRYSRYHLALTH